jgi:hypothetical protein
VAPHVFEQASVPFDGDEQQEPPLFRASPTVSETEPKPSTNAATGPTDVPVSDESLSMFKDFINSLDDEDDSKKNPPNA